MNNESPKTLLHDDYHFQRWIGAFAVKWGMAELSVSFAIGKFLGLNYEDTHLLTAKMPFNKKATLLRAVVKKTKPENESVILGALKTLQNSNRNTLFHAYVLSKADTATFIEIDLGEKFSAKDHTYTLDSLKGHVEKFYEGLDDFNKSVGARPTAELRDFGYAAISLSNKSKTSPSPASA